MSALNKASAAPGSPVLCYVTDRRSLDPAASVASLLGKIQEIASAGVDWVQIREKDLSAKELASLTRDATRASASPGARIFVNDRVDVALTERAGGVHLPESGLPISEVKRLLQTTHGARELKKDFLIGASCHSAEAATAAAKAGADYIFFGPIFATPSKTQYGSLQGVARLTEVCRSMSIPVLAIGGITTENAASCIAAGAAGIAAIRLFQDAQDPASVVHALHQLRR